MEDGKVFTHQELEEMGERTLDSALKAIDAGEKEKAKELCRRMYQESLGTHDSLIHAVTGFMSEIYRRHGSDVLEQAARAVYKVPTEKTAKALGWLSAGTRMVLLIDPETRTLHVYRAADNISVLNEEAELDASDVVPGWRFPVNELFR